MSNLQAIFHYKDASFSDLVDSIMQLSIENEELKIIAEDLDNENASLSAQLKQYEEVPANVPIQ